MHWEKIHLIIGSKNVMKEQFEDLNKQDIPVRLARFRQKNGKEGGNVI